MGTRSERYLTVARPENMSIAQIILTMVMIFFFIVITPYDWYMIVSGSSQFNIIIIVFIKK